MTLRVRLDTGQLARALGTPDQPVVVGDLEGPIIPVVSIEPYLLGTREAGALAAGTSLDFPFALAGIMRVITIPDPVAGAEISATVPDGRAWELTSLHAQLVTSATVVTRLIRLVISGPGTPGDTLLLINDGGLGQAASVSRRWTWGRGINTTNFNNEAGRDLPQFVTLGPRFTVRTVVGNVQPGDQWSFARLLVREWSV